MKQLNVVVIEQLTVFSKEIKELLLTHKAIKDVTTFASLDEGINKISEDDVILFYWTLIFQMIMKNCR